MFGSSVCNIGRGVVVTTTWGSFSTLCSGRVFATTTLWGAVARHTDFQYPVFGSSVCNSGQDGHRRMWGIFQYPVFGSSVCNRDLPAFAYPDEGLSVPCVRVECLQQCRPSVKTVAQQIFQYPVFGSSVCNRVAHLARYCGYGLSVPCVRVECLQQKRVNRCQRAIETFSTLCSGRVFATILMRRVSSALETFSTLCSGRVFATPGRR